jgi:uncharacterized protein YceH (UPF0502 family)
VSGSRVVRFEHNMGRVLGLPSQSVALLAVLMLRGPQTAAELRANCERLHRFSDVSAVEGYLEELAARAAQPYVRLLPRRPGARDSRWVHLLCGEPVLPEPGAEPDRPDRPPGAAAELEALRGRVERLEAEVAALREALAPR